MKMIFTFGTSTLSNEKWTLVRPLTLFCIVIVPLWTLCIVSKFPLQIFMHHVLFSKFPSKQFINMFAQMFETTSFVKFSRIMKSDNSTISMIKSWKFHVFYQSCPLSCTCKLLCVGQAFWRSQILHIFTPQNLVQVFWCVVTLLYFLCKNYVKKHQDSVVT